MSEEQIILAEGGSPKKRLRIALQQFEAQPLLNIRYYYEDKHGEMQPTKKGVSISRNRYLDLVDAIEKHHDSISDYLDTGAVGSDLAEWEYQSKRALADVGAVQHIEAGSSPLPGRDVGHITYQGGKAEVTLNEKHDFVRGCLANKEHLNLVARVLTAVDLSMQLITDSESAEVEHAIERLRHELSRQLRNLTVGS